MSQEGDAFAAVRSLVLKARLLRKMVRNAPSQVSRDQAIVEYTRTLDALLDEMSGLLDRGVRHHEGAGVDTGKDAGVDTGKDAGMDTGKDTGNAPGS